MESCTREPQAAARVSGDGGRRDAGEGRMDDETPVDSRARDASRKQQRLVKQFSAPGYRQRSPGGSAPAAAEQGPRGTSGYTRQGKQTVLGGRRRRESVRIGQKPVSMRWNAVKMTAIPRVHCGTRYLARYLPTLLKIISGRAVLRTLYLTSPGTAWHRWRARFFSRIHPSRAPRPGEARSTCTRVVAHGSAAARYARPLYRRLHGEV